MLKSSVQESEAGEIRQSDGGTTFTGDAMKLFEVKSLQQGIKLHRASGGRMRITRMVNISMLLNSAHNVTGKGPYKKSPKGYERAEKDLQFWLDTLASSIPVTDERTKPV